MTEARDAALQALRLKYNAALTAHQSCMRALTDSALAGTAASAALLESEAQARRTLELAREQLLAAMTAAITGEGPQVAESDAAIASTTRADPSESAV